MVAALQKSADADKVRKAVVRQAIRAILNTYGYTDPEMLDRTPERVAAFWEEFHTRQPYPTMRVFEAPPNSSMVVESGLAVYTMCAHHLLPFHGSAIIAYVPNNKILGVSKLDRILQHYAGQLQTQEHLTKQVGDALQQDGGLDPCGVAVSITCRHLCTCMRGTRATGAWTRTQYLSGCFTQDNVRAEFCAMLPPLPQ